MAGDGECFCLLTGFAVPDHDLQVAFFNGAVSDGGAREGDAPAPGLRGLLPGGADATWGYLLGVVGLPTNSVGARE